MQEFRGEKTLPSQPRVCRTVLRVTALALFALVRPSIAQSDPVEMTVGNYTVVYLQDKSDLRWNFTEAQHYCQQRFGTSLASFHQVGSIRDVYQTIDDVRGEDHSGTIVRYRFGLQCEEEFTPAYGDYEGRKSLPLWQYSDGTRFDYGFGSESVSNGDFTGNNICPNSLTLDATTQTNYPWDLNVYAQSTSALICNVHSNENWQSMNPPRTEFIICDENKDCLLDCSEPPQCQYYRNTDIRDLNSLTVETNKDYGGYGMTIAVLDSGSVSVYAPRSARYSAFHGSTMAFLNCTDVSMNGRNYRSLRASLFILDSNQAVSIKSEFNSGDWITLIAKDCHRIVVDCHYTAACPQIRAELTNVYSVTYLCLSCRNSDFVFRQVMNVHLSCQWLHILSQRGCLNSRFSIDSSNVTEKTSLNISCFGNLGCKAQVWTIKAYDTASLSCQSENSCDFGSTFGSVFTHIPNVSVNCEVSRSCVLLLTVDSPIILSDFEYFSLRCHTSESCYFNHTLLLLDDRPFHFELHSMEADSFDFELFINVSGDSLISEDREVWVFCEGFRSCSDDESEGSALGTMIADVSGYAVSLVVECRGRESCVGSDLSVLSEQSGISVLCSGQKSCDSARVNGYCSWKMEVTLLSDVEDMTVICPSDLSKGECKVSVNSGKMKKSRIGMSASDWDSSKFSLEGQSDAFVQVTSLHLDSDEQDSCEEAGSASQAECFLVFNGNRRWIESLSCSNFVMSLYSPMTILVGSLTTLFGVLFLISAINQKDSHNRGTFNQINSETIMWLRNVMSVMVALLAFTALICSCILIAHQNKASEQGSDGSFSPISPGFYLMCSLNAVCFVGFISCLEVWLVLSNRDGWNPLYSRIRDYFKLNDQSDLRTLIVALIALRNSQMVLFYCFYGLSAVAAGVLCVTVDLLMVIPSRVSIVCIYCLFVWFLLSQYSPLPLAANNQSFFQVITNGTDDESAQVWFDLLSMGMLFSVGCLIITAHSRSHIMKEQSMFLQFFDLATDLTVLAYWLSNGLWLWASIQSVILVSTCVIQWSVLRDDLHHWKEHLMIVTGLGRGYTKIRLWFGKDDRWLSIDRRCSLLETFYESAPSVMFGLYAFLSDVWESHLSGNTLTGVSDDVGPLLISMLITGISIASKTILYSSTVSIPSRFKVTLFFFTLSDFVVRILPLAVLFALLQSDSDNHTVSLGLMVGFPLILLVLLAEQTAVIYHCTIHEHTWQRLSVMYALPLSLTSSPILFHSLQTPGLPLYFDFRVFLKSHLMVSFQSVMVILLCIAVEPTCFVVFLSVMITFFFSLIINLLCVPLIWHI